MLYIPKVGDNLNVLIDYEVKDFVAINFGEYFRSMAKKLYSKPREEQNLRKVVESLYVFLTTSDEAEKYVEMKQSSFLISGLTEGLRWMRSRCPREKACLF